jgi:hypothetical protein
MPNGTTILWSHTCNLLLTDLPPQARQAHILPGLVNSSLISVGQLCDNGCIFTFTNDQVTVTKKKKCVMHGSRDPKSRLWRVNLKQKSETHEIQCNHAHDNNNQKDLINYLHAACFSPVKSTWITAIKKGNFLSWQGLTEHAVEKHLSKSTATTVKLLPLPQPPVRARTDARIHPSAQRSTQLRSVLARVHAVSIQNQITTTVP